MLPSPPNGLNLVSSSSTSSSPSSSRHQPNPYFRLPPTHSPFNISPSILAHPEESTDSHHRQKLDLIRSSLQQFEQKWEEEEGADYEDGGGGGGETSQAEYADLLDDDDEDEEEDEEEADWVENGWRAKMVQKVVEAGYDRESAYYALKLVNFRSVSEAVAVLASVKQNLVKQQQQQQQNNRRNPQGTVFELASSRSLVLVNESSDLVQPESVPNHSPSPHPPAKLENSLPPADPFPRNSHNTNPAASTPYRQRKPAKPCLSPLLNWRSPPPPEHSQRTVHLAHSNAIRQSKSFGPADVLAKSVVGAEQFAAVSANGRRHIHSAGTITRIERNQSERIERKAIMDKKKERRVTAFPFDSAAVSPRNNAVINRCVSPLPESVAKKLKNNTYDRAVKPCRAPMFRFFMEQHIEKLIQQYKERNQREMQLIQEMELAGLAEPVKTRMLRLLRQKESKYIRLRRQKMNRDMFELIRHI
uniref:UBA domain-containing protein n=1 Tax=Globodera pallida TaxID=36090 RepID=A0A183BNL6_GLOPA